MVTSFFEADRWWIYVLRGIAAIVFGVLAWMFPNMALLALVLLFGAYAIVDGAAAIAAVIMKTETERPRWLVVLYGVVSIGAGLIAAFYPGITALALLLLIAARAVVIGVLELLAAIRLRKEVKGEWLLGAVGALSIAFGVLLFMFPGPGARGLILWIGSYTVVFGGLLIALGLKLRSVKRRVGGLVEATAPLREKLAGSS